MPKIPLHTPLFVTASFLALVGGGTVAAIELQHKANLQFAWYVHSPKTGGGSLLRALRGCIKCTDAANRGPAGQFVNEMDQVGLVPSASMSQLAGFKEEACASMVPHSTSLKCTVTPGGSDDNVLCKKGILTRTHHWPYDLVGKPLESLVRNAGYLPVVVGSTRNPFTYYLSHYFFALESQHRKTNSGKGGMPKFGPEHDACVPVAERMGDACIAAFRTGLRQRMLTKGPQWAGMQHYYGSNLSSVPDWAWVPKENIGPSIERILERIVGRPLDEDVVSCLRNRLTQKRKGVIGDLEAARPYYTKELIALVDRVDRKIFERFNYPSLSTG